MSVLHLKEILHVSGHEHAYNARTLRHWGTEAWAQGHCGLDSKCQASLGYIARLKGRKEGEGKKGRWEGEGRGEEGRKIHLTTFFQVHNCLHKQGLAHQMVSDKWDWARNMYFRKLRKELPLWALLTCLYQPGWQQLLCPPVGHEESRRYARKHTANCLNAHPRAHHNETNSLLCSRNITSQNWPPRNGPGTCLPRWLCVKFSRINENIA